MVLTPRHGLVFICCCCCILLTLLFGFSPVSKRLSWVSPEHVQHAHVANNEPSVCVEKKRIAFVKVHKAASTTVTSILQRYGISRNLIFALPNKDLYHIGFFETLHPKNLTPIPKGTTYEILCQHVVYNEEAFAKYLPPDITVIAAVREPLKRFVSTFQFFPEYRRSVVRLSKLNGRTNDTEVIREFLRRPEYYEPAVFKPGSLAVNRMSFDLGIPKTQYNNHSFVENYIKMLDRNMELVLVTEHFDASLVILKRRMCWSTKDILYKTQHKGRKWKLSIPEDISKRVKELSPSDFQIYDYFSKKFETIATIELDLQAEVDLFIEINKKVSEFCNKRQRSASLTLTIDKNPFTDGFTVTNTDCHLLGAPETSHVRLLLRKQGLAVQQQVMKSRKTR